MFFEKNRLFHIYNQGNNRGKLFYEEKNYEYFLIKLKKYVLPYTDILAWCLMPNHFHLMVYIRETEKRIFYDKLSKTYKIRSLNDSIGILLRSYTRAINKQEGRSGSLFRNGTKAVAINSLKSLMPTLAITQNTLLLRSILTEKQYPQICFNYIHLNPVRAKLEKNPNDWKYSSAQDYYGKRKYEITNIDVAQNFVDVYSAPHLSKPLT